MQIGARSQENGCVEKREIRKEKRQEEEDVRKEDERRAKRDQKDERHSPVQPYRQALTLFRVYLIDSSIIDVHY